MLFIGLRTSDAWARALAILCTGVSGALLASAQPVDDDLFDLSLGELLNLEVTSLSRKAQSISQTAAAVFVITNDDIRRSGVTTIADALRLAPGVQVAQQDGNKWAVTARGFNGLYANKLLVLMDGRSVYSQLFSGTFWDTQDAILGDIDRIEVIRGPGATLWGSNAVNGVINIITRTARETQGRYLAAGIGNQERGFLGFRYGASLGERGDYRVYAKFFERDGNELESGGDRTADDWRQKRLGFRADILSSEKDRFTLQGDVYTGVSGETSTELSLLPPYVSLVEEDQNVDGFNLLGRWQRDLSSTDQLSVQSYADRERRDWALINHDRLTADIDAEFRTRRFDKHDIVVGVGYRRIHDDFDNSQRLFVNPETRTDKLLSLFVQDDISLKQDRWTLTAGMKLERNDYTGWEYQPNLRLLWTPDQRRSFWASVTRGVRIPGRADRESNALLQVIPPAPPFNPLPLAIRVQGDPDFESETLIAYEAGFKFQASDSLGLDVATYFNNYQNLRSVSTGIPSCEPAGALPNCIFAPGTTNLVVQGMQGNGTEAENTGIEIALDWRPSERWRLQGNYALQHQDLSLSSAQARTELVSFLDPKHMISLRGSLNPRPNIDLDIWLRHQSEARGAVGVIDEITNFDARIAWRPHPASELALVGRNLLDQSQLQFIGESGIRPPIAIQRSVHLQFTLEF